MGATLLIMAAGMGSRYGGNKQVDGLGPNGEILMEYSIYDAIRAGFDKVVFVIKPGMKETLASICGDRIAKKVSLKEQVIDFPPQPVITKDNVTMQIDTVVYFQITDPKLYAYGVENPISAIENLTATTLRNIIGEMELDHTLTSRDVINSKIRVVLDEATDAWGIKVNRV